jgi:hypothetical protein
MNDITLSNIQGLLSACAILLSLSFIVLLSIDWYNYKAFKQLKALNEKLSQGGSK